MVGPGTGIASLRGFVQAAEDGGEIGKMLLFLGCGNQDADFLYGDEWETSRRHSSASWVARSRKVKAFSREQKHRVYVQHKLTKDYAKQINKLAAEGALFFTCRDAANMAREINSELSEIIEQEGGLKPGGGGEVMKMLRASNAYGTLYIRLLFVSP
jgi:sulfite reductase alpha subunit-like flavoprotein